MGLSLHQMDGALFVLNKSAQRDLFLISCQPANVYKRTLLVGTELYLQIQDCALNVLLLQQHAQMDLIMTI